MLVRLALVVGGFLYHQVTYYKINVSQACLIMCRAVQKHQGQCFASLGERGCHLTRHLCVTGTTDADMEFDYLLEMGPHFRRLADIYGVSERFGRASSDSEDGEPSAATLDTEPGESWC